MASKVVDILTKKYDENYIIRMIEDIYHKSGFPKPRMLVFDTIPTCKLAYRLLLTYISNNSENLTDEHEKIKYSNNEIPKDLKLSILNIVKIIENHDCVSRGLPDLPEIKTQLLKNIKPEFQERVWNSIVNSKANFFEFNFDNYKTYILSEGIILGIFLKNYCILCKNPNKILENKPEELHSTDGFAIEFSNKTGIYFVEGIEFEPELYTRVFIKKDITGKEILKIKEREKVRVAIKFYGYNKLVKEFVGKDIIKLNDIKILNDVLEIYDHDRFLKEINGKDIIKIKNVEIRATLIKFFGYDNLIKELNAKLIDAKDEFNNIDNLPLTNELWEFEMEIERRRVRRFERNELTNLMKFRFVKVEDWSTRKKVCLGVPINEQTNTVLGALAWTFGMTEEEYVLNIQT